MILEINRQLVGCQNLWVGKGVSLSERWGELIFGRRKIFSKYFGELVRRTVALASFISLQVLQRRNKFTPPKFQQKLSAGRQIETPCLLPTFRLRKSRKENAWHCVNFITKYLAVLNLLTYRLAQMFAKHLPLFGSSQKVSAESLGKYKTIEQKLSTGQLTLAQSIIAAFSPTSNIENNYKTFYTLQRAYLQNQDLTLLENIQLLLLAYQCPFTDGQVVYNARALYNLVNQTAVVYNDYNCASKGFSFKPNNTEGNNNQLSDDELLLQLTSNEKISKEKFKYANEYILFPNPAYNEFSILSNQAQELLQITITDVNGKALQSKKVQTNNYSTNLTINLLNGIYFVNIVNEQGEKIIKKLVVAK